jgi:hypothetical protein
MVLMLGKKLKDLARLIQERITEKFRELVET